MHHLETITEFKRMQSTNKIGYTYFRFEKNAHKELHGCPVAAIKVNGAYILIPFSKSRSKNRLISDEMINERLHQVVEAIQSDLAIKTDPRAHSVEELLMDEEMAREYDCSEKSLKTSGRSKPPSVPCGIQLRVKPGPGPDARTALF